MSGDRSSVVTMPQVLDRLRSSLLGDFRVSIPAIVTEYDPTTQQISAKPTIRQRVQDESGEFVSESLPVVNNVPVVSLGGGGFRLVFPMQVGDPVCLLFTDVSLDKWLSVGGSDVDPLDDRAHDLTDAIAIPGVRSGPGALKDAPTDRLSLGVDNGSAAKIEITATEVQAGGTSPLATKADIDSLASFIATHKHLGVTTGAGTSGVPDATPPSATGTQTLKGG